jgi:Trypsin-like peptidase domain
VDTSTLDRLTQRLDRLRRPSRLRVLAVIVASMAVVSACASVASRQVALADKTRAQFERALATFNQVQPKPVACSSGYIASPDGYIVELANWSEESGLRRGDRLTSISGVPVTTQEDRSRVLAAVPPGGPVVIVVSRQGRTLTVTLPCRDASKLWVATHLALESGARGDWDGCVAASQEAIRYFGRAYYVALNTILVCTEANSRALRNTGYWQLVYEAAHQRVRESRYVPGGVDQARGWVLTMATQLTQNGFATLAGDLEAQLHEADQGQVGVQASPASPPAPKISRGSGFAVTADGTVLTAFHIVQDARSITVKCPDAPSALAELRETAATTDLAVLRIARPTPAYLPLARPRSIRLGDPVFTVGFPATDLLGVEPKFRTPDMGEVGREFS